MRGVADHPHPHAPQVTQFLPLQDSELASIQLSKLWRHFLGLGGWGGGGTTWVFVGGGEVVQYRGGAEVAGTGAWPGAGPFSALEGQCPQL